MARIDHRKNNARLRGLKDHEPTEAQKKRDAKLGATPEWKEKMARKALKMRAQESRDRPDN